MEVELIERDEPAVMLCHWPGMYTQGTKSGYADFKRVVVALEGRFRDRTLWMKVTEIARYWGAKELTTIECEGDRVTFKAPFACPGFTVRIPAKGARPRASWAGEPIAMQEVSARRALAAGKWWREGESTVICFDLPKGTVTVTT